MKQSYDLTTTSGRNNAAKLAGLAGLYVVAGPVGLLAKFTWDKVSDWLDTDKSIEKQSVIARKLIADGKKHGLEELYIKLDKKAGLDLGGSYEGIPLKVGFNNDGSMEIKATYGNK